MRKLCFSSMIKQNVSTTVENNLDLFNDLVWKRDAYRNDNPSTEYIRVNAQKAKVEGTSKSAKCRSYTMF